LSIQGGRVVIDNGISSSVKEIHCIQFGEGPKLQVPNWLREIAAQNGGAFRQVKRASSLSF